MVHRHVRLRVYLGWTRENEHEQLERVLAHVVVGERAESCAERIPLIDQNANRTIAW